MNISIRTIVLGLPLAFGAMAVRADPTAWNTVPTTPLPGTAASTPLSTAIDLSLHSTATPLALPDDPLQSASSEVKAVARWVLNSRDNARLPFLLVDKANALVYAFSGAGQLQGSAPALLGMSHGDRLLAPNDAPMDAITPEERITPAGRFVSKLAIDSHDKELLVIDYEASISLHPVVKGTPEEHRAERLASATSLDNRISYGCINVPPAFYSTVVSPAFTGTWGIVYILPESAPAGELFGFQRIGATAPVAAGSTALTALPAQPMQAPQAPAR